MNFKRNESAQKLRGGYYTPLDLASFLARWVKQIKPRSLLEPSCGDGIFFSALAAVGGFGGTSLTGFELDSKEAKKARERGSSVGLDVKVYSEDFLNWALKQLGDGGQRFDAIVGNPPFVRYQYLPPEFQARSERVFTQLNQHFTKHTNAWVPFILASFALLRPGGRMAMVVPAEIIHVTHAQSLRSYLGAECKRLVIVDPEELWFTGTLQGAVLLLAEKRRSIVDTAEGVGIYPVRGREFLDLNPADVFAAPISINGKTVEGKWTRALLDVETRDLIDELEYHPEVHQFEDIAQVDVGIVTGANKFFLVDDKTVKDFGLEKWAHPMFGRSEHCPGVIYDREQHRTNARKGNPTNFIWFDDKSVAKKKKNKGATAYIQLGKKQGLHTRYKCRVRAPWYSVPSVYATEIGMLKRSHHTPRLILNKIGAYTTDTAYRIRSKVPAEILVSSFINPLTALSAELEGRHYGGGVLELVPSEIERLMVPLPGKIKFNLKDLDKAIRTLPTEQVLEKQGGRVLGGLGISKSKQSQLLGAWHGLRNRRQRTTTEINID
jgi:adenine-specific DNA-methyltransferase